MLNVGYWDTEAEARRAAELYAASKSYGTHGTAGLKTALDQTAEIIAANQFAREPHDG